jgi:hypothetical protein
MKQVFQRAECYNVTDNGSRVGRRCTISPVRRDHRFAAIGQDQNKIAPPLATHRCPNGKGLALKGMTNAGYSDSLGKVLMMGSVS